MKTVEVAPDIATRYSNGQEQLLAGLRVVEMRIRWAVARARAVGLDPDDEFRGLYISDDHIDTLLGYEFGHHLWTRPVLGGAAPPPHSPSPAANGHDWPHALDRARRQWETRTRAGREAGVHYPLDHLARAFDLSPAEIDVLLIALAPELDPRYERFFAYLQDDVTRKRPSVDLILNLLAGSFEEKLQLRALLADDSPLIGSRLLLRLGDVNQMRQTPLLAQTVRPAANVIEYLLGRPALDESLAGNVELWLPGPATSLRHSAVMEQLLAACQRHAEPPLLAFFGPAGAGRQDAAAQLATEAGRPMLIIDLTALAAGETGLAEGLRLATRDGRLLGAALYLNHWEAALVNGRPQTSLFRQLLTYPHLVAVASAGPWQAGHRQPARAVYSMYFDVPDYEERLQLWEFHLDNPEELDLRQVAGHFRLTPGQIRDAAATARDLARWQGRTLTAEDLLAAGRAHSNQNLATLATKIQPRYTWADIVLPDDTMRQLQEMVNTVRHRPQVYDRWGFGRKMALGKGLNTLFAGESGTGKTMAADIMAGALGLDLYKIDLSTLVSKYIGETEKNLDHIFREAATSNAVLFFDEADAIFGKRSEVKDSHDRYANIEISYLLQRMEMYEGVVILATNLRANLDEAFTRRLHFVVEFPFPEADDRERIWRVNVPTEAPVAADLDFALLAQRFRITGGGIRNIILAAAFLAAEGGKPVGLAHILHAARREYQKMGRLLDEKLFSYEVSMP